MRASHCARLAMLAAAASGVGALKVAVTGASGKTGSLCFKKLYERADTDVVGIVRRKLRKATKKLCAAAGDKKAAERVFEADVTSDSGSLETLLREQSVDALLIATSAVPRIKKSSLVRMMAYKLLGRKGLRPSFDWKYGGTPEQVDWLGQKAQIDAAKAAGVKHVVICSSMGGTQPDNFLNSIGKAADGSGGDILLWKRKAEKYAVDLPGLDYTIVHPGGLTDKPGGRTLVLGVNDALMDRESRSIPRDDVAEVAREMARDGARMTRARAAQVMVRSLFVRNARNRAFDLVSEDSPRASDAEVDALLEGFKGKTDYALKLPEPTSAGA